MYNRLKTPKKGTPQYQYRRQAWAIIANGFDELAAHVRATCIDDEEDGDGVEQELEKICDWCREQAFIMATRAG